MRCLIETFRAVEGVTIDPTSAALVVRFGIPGTDVQASVFAAWTNSALAVWPQSTIAKQLERAGLDPEVAARYGERMRSIMNMPGDRIDFYRRIGKLDLQQFMDAAAAFIEEVQRTLKVRCT